MGIVYILHLDTPLHHAKHYTGWSTNGRTIRRRLDHHANGTAGCKFTRALHEKGITFTVARLFKGVDRHFERALKNTHKVTKYCPICNPNAPAYKPKENHHVVSTR